MDEGILLASQANNHELLEDVLKRLTFNQFVTGKSFDIAKQQISDHELRKTIWLVSILAISEEEAHRIRAQRFASLLYLQYGQREEIERLAYILMSRVGNLTATNLFNRVRTNRSEEDFLFDSALTLELALERDSKIIHIHGESLLSTKFQKELWDKLSNTARVAISAPTSAGKSFILKKRIQQLFIEPSERARHCLYIVPSRALINQVSDEFRVELSNIANVYTSFLDSDFETNSIYILTPERCLRLLKNVETQALKFDLIFVDEIQNIEEEGGRGALMEYVVDILNTAFPDAQLVVAGPFIENAGSLFKELFRENAFEVKTVVSPVIQIKSIIRGLDKDRISVSLDMSRGDEPLALNIGFDLNEALSNNIGAALARIIPQLAGDEHSIIYSPKTNLAEGWARHCSIKEGENASVHPRIIELIEYLSEEIHPKYYLIKCLRSGVAFHHGRLPDMVRKEVEDNFKEKHIKRLFCTSTLIEGVNLPAKNLFIVKPEKSDSELSNFEFGNLIGRSGRLGESLYGNVFCIEQPDRANWAQRYFEHTYEKVVMPATTKALKSVDAVLSMAGKLSGKYH